MSVKSFSNMVLFSCIQYKVSCLQFLVCTKYKLSSIRLIRMFCIFSQLHQKSLNPAIYQYIIYPINPLQLTLAFYIETNQLIISVNQGNCFNKKCNTWLRWIKIFSLIMFRTLYQKYCWNYVKHFEQGKTGQMHNMNSQRNVNATFETFALLQVVLFFKSFITNCMSGECILNLMILLFGKT